MKNAVAEKTDKATDRSAENKDKAEAEKPRREYANDEEPNASLQ